MALAALIISIAVAMFTGWQALVQHQATRIERDRRHDERTPAFEFQSYVDKGEMHIAAKLISPWPLDTVRLELSGAIARVKYPRHGDSIHEDTYTVTIWAEAGTTFEWIVNDTFNAGIGNLEGFLRCRFRGERDWLVPVKLNEQGRR
jgi:hypothetical protein